MLGCHALQFLTPIKKTFQVDVRFCSFGWHLAGNNKGGGWFTVAPLALNTANSASGFL
jgi:hypothetical protein